MKKKLITFNDRIIAERLEPRVLFSADPMGLAVGALLLDDQDAYATPASFESFSEINIGTPEEDHAPAAVELIFIDIRADSTREDIQAILAEDRGNAIVHVIDSQTGGIDSISAIIAQQDAVNSIHLLVHGDNQGLRIGSDWLDINSVDGFEDQLASWNQYLTEDADVLLYGCDLTIGADGLSLIEQLAMLTGADVAASDNTTGHTNRGGDWELENTTGVIETKSLGTERMQQDWDGSLDLIVVTTLDDVVDMNLGTTPDQLNDGVINHKGADGLISLREAVIAANNTSGADEIMLASGTYVLDRGVYGETEDWAQSGDLDIRQDVVISGATSGNTTISGNSTDRIFDIFDGQTTLLQNLTLQDGELSELDNGDGHGAGAAIRIFGGDTTLSHVTIQNNNTTTADGGAIWLKSGELTIENSVIRDNEAILDGGAIEVLYDDSTLNIANTEIYNNTAGQNGGGIAAHAAANVNITSTYIHSNTAALNGGGLFFETNGNIDPTKGLVNIEATTFATNDANNGAGAFISSNLADIDGATFNGNDATESGGGLTVFSGNAEIDHSTFYRNRAGVGPLENGDAINVETGTTSLTIGSSIIADNRIGNLRPDINGPVTSSGFNLISDPIAGINHFSDIESADVGLELLTSVGNNPPTNALQDNSPAINAGATRPDGFDAHGVTPNLFSDIGAVEHESGGNAEQMLFWADDDGWIYRANADGTDEPQRIFQTDIANDMRPFDIEYDSATGRVYWSETDGVFGSLRSIDVNGGNLKETPVSAYNDALKSPHGIAIDSSDPNAMYLYVVVDAIANENSDPFTLTAPLSANPLNQILRYEISSDGSLTYDSVAMNGIPVLDPEISNPLELEYIANLDGREVLIWSEAGDGSGIGAQVNIFDLTPSSTINPIPGTTSAAYVGSGLSVDPATGLVYISGNGNNITNFAVDLDGPTVTNTADILNNPSITGLQFGTNTLWGADTNNGIVGNVDPDLTNPNIVYTYAGSPVAITLADIPVLNVQPTVTNTGIVDLPEGDVQFIGITMLSAVDSQTLPAGIEFSLASIPTEGDLLLGGALLNNVGDTFTQDDIDNNLLSYNHYGDEGLEDGFAFTVQEPGNNPSAEYFFAITLIGENETPPVANEDSIVVDEGGTATTLFDPLAGPLDTPIDNVTDNDTDADESDTMTVAFGPTTTSNVAYVLLANGSYDTPAGNIKLETDGTFTYTHNDGEVFTDSFTYVVTDSQPAANESNEVVVSIDINPVNDNTPIAVPDKIVVNENSTATTLEFGQASLLHNDTDDDIATDNGDGDTLTVVPMALTPTTNGSIQLFADGSFIYTNNGNENYTDSFDYTVIDEAGHTDTVTVQVEITPVNDNTPVGVADKIVVDENGTATTLEFGQASLLHNDTDDDIVTVNGDGDTLTVVPMALTPTANGSIQLFADGTFEYIHNGNENYTDSFDYTVIDEAGHTDTITVQVEITPVNDSTPVAAADKIVVDENGTATTLEFGQASLLHNDTDDDILTVNGDGDTLTVVPMALTPTANGSIQLSADGTFEYIHNGNENYTDSFDYTVIDEAGHTDTITVQVEITPVNDSTPVAVADKIVVDENGTATTLEFGQASLLHNDTDDDIVTVNGDGDTLTVVPMALTPTANGSIQLSADGTFEYIHNGNENYTDSFEYTVIDEAGHTDTITVQVEITPVNDSTPVAVADKIVVDENGTATTLEFGQTSLLHNDTDGDILTVNGDGDTLTVVPMALTPTANGSIQLFADGSFIYTNNGNENYTDTFDYTVIDEAGHTDTITVQVEITPVNDAPNAVDDIDNVDEGGLSDQLPGNISSILANDSDPENEKLSASIVEGPSHGSLSLDPDTGRFIYQHDGSETSEDSYTYAVTDASGASSKATVNITVKEINDDPEAQDDEYTISEGGLLAHPTASVLDNDTDAENETLLAELVGTGPINAESFELYADGTFSYQHDGSETTADSFTYIAKDTRTGVSSVTTVSISITEFNDAPIGIDDSYNVDEGELLNHPTASVLDNDTDAENNNLTVELATGPSNSSAFSLLASGQFSYQHDGSETTQDTFTYVAKDQNNVSSEVEVTITINPVNDVPVPASSAATELAEPDTGNLTLPDNLFTDAEEDPLIYSVIEYTDGNDVTMPGLPAWLTFNPEDNSFVVEEESKATNISVLVVATDPNDGTSEPKTIFLNFKPRLGAVSPDEIDVDVPEIVISTPEVETLAEKPVEPTPTPVANQPEIISSSEISINEAINFEHIDIASLIKPLPAIAAEGVSSTAEYLADLAASVADDAIQSNNIEQLAFEFITSESFNRGLDSLADSFDEQKELLEEAYNQSRTEIGRSITLTSGLSVGYLLWLIRGGTLMGSVLSSMPAWRLVDPLPILSSLGDDFDDSDDSLASMVEHSDIR